MKEVENCFANGELVLLRRMYEDTKSLRRCENDEEYLEKNYPNFLNLWHRFKSRGVKNYYSGECKSFEDCYESLLWPKEWIQKVKSTLVNRRRRPNLEFQELLGRVLKENDVIILED